MQHILSNHQYFGAFFMMILSFFIFGLIIYLSSLAGKKFSNTSNEKLKTAIYESGPEAIKQPNRININFYLFGLLFILFDVEIIFMFPWAVNFKALGVFGLIEMIMFLLFIFLGFMYAWNKGAFKWHSIK